MAMTLRLTEEDEQLLAELAAVDGVSRQEATLRAIRETLQRRRHETKVRDASQAARQRYATVLERLGE
ncbi:MAG: CopG family transcriptional regulator [Actinomycetales bacterium]|nr:MAG: CopG family transcriptional regulator [Actinomycetales bacterium]